MNKLTLVIASLGCGGAERVLSNLANEWAARGKEITLITLSHSDTDFYQLHHAVRRIAMDVQGDSRGLGDALRNNTKRLVLLRRAIKQAAGDAIISFGDTTNALVLAATLGLRTPVIVSERVDPTQMSIGRAHHTLRLLVYRRASAIVMQTEALRSWAQRFLSKERVFVIPNPVHVPSSTVPAAIPDKVVLAAGRLVPQKGFDLLLQAFAVLAKSFSEWRLVIYGEGPSRVELEALTTKLEIRERVSLPGVTTDLSAALHAASVFAFPSRFEGFPNALIEAMAHGLPVVAADCPTGPGEIVRTEVDGLLVPVEDVDALARALRRLMEDQALRSRLGEKARDVRDRYSMERVLAMWDTVLMQCK